MTCCQQNTTVCFIFANYVGRRRRGQDRILPNDKLCDTVCGTDLENRLYGLWGKVTTITANNQGGSLRIDGIEDGLNEILCIVLV